LLGTGADEVFGEEGNDTFSARHDELGAGDRTFGGEGTADKLVVTSNGLLDLTLLDAFVGVEQVTLQVAQTAIGSDANILWNDRGGAEDFTLGAGRDLVKAGHGNDIVRGGDGADILLGRNGDDRLIGQAGTDRMKGGSGNDVFVATVGSGLDIVYDFTVGEDKVDVSGLGFTDFEAEVGSIWRTVNGKALMEMGVGDRLLLVGVDHTTLTADDFILA
jgi:Ca2+-binding RTX toxin-like protein